METDFTLAMKKYALEKLQTLLQKKKSDQFKQKLEGFQTLGLTETHTHTCTYSKVLEKQAEITFLCELVSTCVETLLGCEDGRQRKSISLKKLRGKSVIGTCGGDISWDPAYDIHTFKSRGMRTHNVRQEEQK